MAIALCVTRMVWPSGTAWAAIAVPSVLPAPGRLSTRPCWPNESWNICATKRAAMSLPPPGANGTMMRIGRVG